MNQRVIEEKAKHCGSLCTPLAVPRSRARGMRYPLLYLSIMLWLLIACQPIDRERWEIAQETVEAQKVISEADVLSGGEFNKFFPEPEDPFDIVFLQEKEGFAEASLQVEGEDVATLAVSDTANNPSARDKYAQSDDTLESYPLVAVGNNGSAILVADRFQVQVRSKAADFVAEDRESWLLEFDLDGLAGLAD